MKITQIQILLDAESDLEEGRSFYGNQQYAIGEYFWDCFLSDIESLVIYAGVHAKQYGYYRMSSKRFPYSIYYDMDGEVAYIIAVLPMRKNPDWIMKIMSNRGE